MKVEYDNALNEAGWKMVEEMRLVDGLSAKHFNSIKPCLKSAIECWISHKYEFEVPTETPEERESLDMIDTASKGVESLANNSELPNSSEWKNGDKCEVFSNGEWHSGEHTFIGESKCKGKYVICYDCLTNYFEAQKENVRKPETPEQKAERERLEAAYDLYCNAQHAVDVIGYDSFGVFNSDKVQVKFWLSIVDKTGYRKAK